MKYHFFSFRLFLTGHQVSNCPRYRFSPSAFRKQLTGHSGQTGRDFVFIFSLGHLLMTPTKMGKTNINLTSVTFHLYLAPQMLPSFSRRHKLNISLIFKQKGKRKIKASTTVRAGNKQWNGTEYFSRMGKHCFLVSQSGYITLFLRFPERIHHVLVRFWSTKSG